MLMCLGLLRIADRLIGAIRTIDIFRFTAWIWCGAILIYIGRPYVVSMVQWISIAVIAGLAVLQVKNNICNDRAESAIRIVAYAGVCSLVFISLTPLTKGAASGSTIAGFSSEPGSSQKQGITKIECTPSEKNYPIVCNCLMHSFNGWRKSDLIPSVLDYKLKAIFSQRCLYFMLLDYPNAARRYAVRDWDIYPSSAYEALKYLPRGALKKDCFLLIL